MAVLVVARRAEIGRVDLQHEAGFDDGAVFDLEHVGERGDVSLLGRIMQVDDEARQNARRRRGHEHLGGLRFRRRGFEMRQIAVERGAVHVAQVADAAGKRHGGEIAALAGEVRKLQHVAADHDVAALFRRARVHLDAADPVADIGRVRRLAHLAVGDHVDAGRDLLRHDVVDRLDHLGLEGVRRDRLALLAAQNEVDQRLRPRQAAGMGGEDAVGRGLHGVLRPGVVAVSRGG